MNRHLALFLLLIIPFLFIPPGYAEELPFTTPDTTTHHWIGHRPTHVIAVQPLMFMTRGGGGSYEQVFAGRYGLYLEGGVSRQHGYVAKLAYLRYNPRYDEEPALLSPHWGAFVRYGRMIQNLNSDHFDMITVHGGLLYGRSFTMGRYIRVAGHLGAGLPLYWDITWTPEKPPVYNIVDLFSVVYVSIELGFSVGFMW